MDKETNSLQKYEELVLENLLEWIDSSKPLDPEMKQELLARFSGLRLKFQVLMLEIEKRIFKEFALDVEAETEFRSQLRRSFPYMSTLDQKDMLKTFSSINEERLKRLETQMTGWDFMSTIETALDTLSEIVIPGEISQEVKKMSISKRAKLMSSVQNIAKEIENANKRESDNS